MRVVYPAILFIPLYHVERSETSLDVLRSRSCKEINLRFFASLRMTERLPPCSAAAEDSAKQAASDLPTYPIAGRTHCAFNH
jgi:hypothetical protein